jgi:hypothetical protein
MMAVCPFCFSEQDLTEENECYVCHLPLLLDGVADERDIDLSSDPEQTSEY